MKYPELSQYTLLSNFDSLMALTTAAAMGSLFIPVKRLQLEKETTPRTKNNADNNFLTFKPPFIFNV